MSEYSYPKLSEAIKSVLLNDLPQVVDIHIKSFPNFFLTFLGKDFLLLLYKGICNEPDGIILGAFLDDQIEGFIAGVTNQCGFYKRLIKRQKWAFAFASLKALLRCPRIAPRLLRALRKPSEAQQASAEACLMSIAVRPEYEGKGIGRQLVEAFNQELINRGISSVCLTTDKNHNDRVNQFYQKLGFCLSRSYVTPEGRAMNEYLIHPGRNKTES
ncbi:MAG: GNAT family N-acetyltransferase [bacterium]